MTCKLRRVTTGGIYTIVIRNCYEPASAVVIPPGTIDPTEVNAPLKWKPYALDITIIDATGRTGLVCFEDHDHILRVYGTISGSYFQYKLVTERVFDVTFHSGGRLTMNTVDGQPLGDNLSSSFDFQLTGL